MTHAVTPPLPPIRCTRTYRRARWHGYRAPIYVQFGRRGGVQAPTLRIHVRVRFR